MAETAELKFNQDERGVLPSQERDLTPICVHDGWPNWRCCLVLASRLACSRSIIL